MIVILPSPSHTSHGLLHSCALAEWAGLVQSTRQRPPCVIQPQTCSRLTTAQMPRQQSSWAWCVPCCALFSAAAVLAYPNVLCWITLLFETLAFIALFKCHTDPQWAIASVRGEAAITDCQVPNLHRQLNPGGDVQQPLQHVRSVTEGWVLSHSFLRLHHFLLPVRVTSVKCLTRSSMPRQGLCVKMTIFLTLALA